MQSQQFATYLSADKIQQRIGELGDEITRDYEGKELVVVGVLNGAFIFMADLVRRIRLPLTCEFTRVSSYGSGKVSGELKFLMDVNPARIEGRHILLVEDIVDTGNSIVCLTAHLGKYKPQSVKICSLLLKEAQLRHRVHVDYLGFKIDSLFVIGYGLDLDEKYRNLPEIQIHP